MAPVRTRLTATIYRLAEAYPRLAVLGSRRRSDHHVMWWSGVASLSSQSIARAHVSVVPGSVSLNTHVDLSIPPQ